MNEYGSGGGRPLDWDDEIQYVESSYVTLKAGTYPFTVTGFERKYHDGSAKIPPCKMVLVHLEVNGGEQGIASVDERLYLHTSIDWKLSEFFVGIGQLDKDGKMRMNWNAVPGAAGMVEITVNKYEKNGEERTNNRVKRFLPPEGSRNAVPASPPRADRGEPDPGQQQRMEGFQRQGRMAEAAPEWTPGKF